MNAITVPSHAGRVRASPYLWAMGLLLVFLVVGPFVIYPVFLMKALCFALFACAFNLLFGYAGLMSFGHAAFFGVGSYVAAWMVHVLHVPPELALVIGSASGALLGLVIGAMSIRLSGMSFAMVTLALSQMVYFVCIQAPFTGGENGLVNSVRGDLLGRFSLESDATSYIFVATVFFLAFLLIARIVHSPFGQILKAIRDNEARALSMGYNVNQYKLMAFVLSSTLAATAGSLKALVFGLATLADVHFSASGEVVLMALVGGIGTLFGPMVGALVTTAMWSYLAQFGSWVTFIQGAIFVACVLMFRRGIVGEVAAIVERRSDAKENR